MPSTLPSTRVRVAVGILGLVCTPVAFLLVFCPDRRGGAGAGAVITYFNPAVALVLGIVLLHEPFTLGAGVGFVLILLGSFLATRSGPGTARVRDVALGDAAAGQPPVERRSTLSGRDIRNHVRPDLTLGDKEREVPGAGRPQGGPLLIAQLRNRRAHR